MLDDRTRTRADRIALAIAESGHTHASIARMVGCTRSAVSQWTSGSTANIKNEFLFALEDATHYCARWLATGEGPRKVSEAREVARLLDEAPADVVRESLDYLGYKIQQASPALMTRERAAKYLTWIDAIKSDMNNRKASDDTED